MNPESILKGRMAEALVSEILRESGNQVYRFGYESILQNLTQVDKIFDHHSEIGEKIRSIPDLLVINKKGEPFFVELPNRHITIKIKNYPDGHWKKPVILIYLKRILKNTIIW